MPRKSEWRDRALRWEKMYYRRNLDLIQARKQASVALFNTEVGLADAVNQALAERDRARTVAVALEQENAHLKESLIASQQHALRLAFSIRETVEAAVSAQAMAHVVAADIDHLLKDVTE